MPKVCRTSDGTDPALFCYYGTNPIWDFWNRIDFKKLEYCLSEIVASKRTANIELSADEIIEKSGAFINCEKYGKTVIKSLLIYQQLD